MTATRRISDLSGMPTQAQARQNIDSHGAHMVAGQVVNSGLDQTVGNLTIPATIGKLIQIVLSPTSNPIDLIKFGTTVPEVLKFSESSGQVGFALFASFTVVGSQGSRAWTYQAEIGIPPTDFDQAVPDAPDFIQPAFGATSNQTETGVISAVFEFSNLVEDTQVQLRLLHDGGAGFDIVPETIGALAFGLGSGRPLRLR